MKTAIFLKFLHILLLRMVEAKLPNSISAYIGGIVRIKHENEGSGRSSLSGKKSES